MTHAGIGANPIIIDAWSEAWNLTDSDRKIISLYTAIFCVGFISEMGLSFNGQGRPFDEQRYRRYAELIDSLLPV